VTAQQAEQLLRRLEAAFGELSEPRARLYGEILTEMDYQAARRAVEKLVRTFRPKPYEPFPVIATILAAVDEEQLRGIPNAEAYVRQGRAQVRETLVKLEAVVAEDKLLDLDEASYWHLLFGRDDQADGAEAAPEPEREHSLQLQQREQRE